MSAVGEPVRETRVQCCHCWAEFSVLIDLTAAGLAEQEQQWVEDCAVCCHPMLFELRTDAAGEPQLSVSRTE